MMCRMANVWASSAGLASRRSLKWRRYPADVLPLWVAEMDVELAEPVQAALVNAVRRSDTGYAHPNGLYEAFAGFATRRYGWHADPGQMFLMPDVASGAIEALRVVTAPGDGVVVNTPVYPPFFSWIERTGRRLVASPLAHGPDGYSLDLARLEADFAAGARAYLLCNPHNPTGLVHTWAELSAVARLADRYGVRIVSDEIHAPLTYFGHTHIPFAMLDADAARRAFILVSASKAWNLAGLKCALLVAGEDASDNLARIPKEVQYGAGLLGVLASIAAFDSGEAWLDELLAALDTNRRLLADLRASHLPAVGYQLPQATYLAWLDFRRCGLGDDPAAVLLERTRVALSAGPEFGDEGTGFARLNLATTPELITEAVFQIARAMPEVAVSRRARDARRDVPGRDASAREASAREAPGGGETPARGGSGREVPDQRVDGEDEPATGRRRPSPVGRVSRRKRP